MVRSWQTLVGVLVTFALMMATDACRRGPSADQGPTQPASTATGKNGQNVTAPGWIYRDPAHPHPVAVVFVHGIFGDALGTWRNSAGTTMLDYLHQYPGIGDKVDIYAFGFTSAMLGGGSLKIGEAANKLDDYLVRDGVAQYDQIVFVAHSMGGLVTMRALILHPEIARKTPLLVFYATPHEGSQITNIAQYVVGNNPAVRQMLPVDDANDYLQQLNEDWTQVRGASPHPHMVCAYETMDTGPVRIVPWASSTRNCDDVASAIEHSNHVTIVKPDDPSAPAMVLLEKAFQQHVLPTLDPAAWETPDIQDEQGQWTFLLRNIGDRNPVFVKNRGSIPQHYSIEPIDVAHLLVDPPAMPQDVAAAANATPFLVPIGDVQPEYKFRLRLGSLPEREVTARFADLAAATAARNKQTGAVADHINAYFASNDNSAHFLALSPDGQQAELARLAGEAVAQQAPNLSDGMHLLVTADTLKTLNLANSAAVALGTLQARDPAAARSPGAQHLAGVIATRTGKADVLGPVAVPKVPEAEAVKPADLQSTSDAQREAISRLADNLRTVPATQVEATVLKGDVLQASGETAAAARVYTEASTATPTPVVRDRLRRAAVVHP